MPKRLFQLRNLKGCYSTCCIPCPTWCYKENKTLWLYTCAIDTRLFLKAIYKENTDRQKVTLKCRDRSLSLYERERYVNGHCLFTSGEIWRWGLLLISFGSEVGWYDGVAVETGDWYAQVSIIFIQHIVDIGVASTQAQHMICHINHSRRQKGEEKAFYVWVVECMCLDGRGEENDWEWASTAYPPRRIGRVSERWPFWLDVVSTL